MKRIHNLFKNQAFYSLLAGVCSIIFIWPSLISANPNPKTIFFFLFTSWAVVIIFLFFIGRNYEPPDDDRHNQIGDSQDV